MNEAKTYELDGDSTVEFRENGAYISNLGASVTVFLTWAALDALDEARYEYNLPFADLPPEGKR